MPGSSLRCNCSASVKMSATPLSAPSTFCRKPLRGGVAAFAGAAGGGVTGFAAAAGFVAAGLLDGFFSRAAGTGCAARRTSRGSGRGPTPRSRCSTRCRRRPRSSSRRGTSRRSRGPPAPAGSLRDMGEDEPQGDPAQEVQHLRRDRHDLGRLPAKEEGRDEDLQEVPDEGQAPHDADRGRRERERLRDQGRDGHARRERHRDERHGDDALPRAVPKAEPQVLLPAGREDAARRDRGKGCGRDHGLKGGELKHDAPQGLHA